MVHAENKKNCLYLSSPLGTQHLTRVQSAEHNARVFYSQHPQDEIWRRARWHDAVQDVDRLFLKTSRHCSGADKYTGPDEHTGPRRSTRDNRQ